MRRPTTFWHTRTLKKWRRRRRIRQEKVDRVKKKERRATEGLERDKRILSHVGNLSATTLSHVPF